MTDNQCINAYSFGFEYLITKQMEIQTIKEQAALFGIKIESNNKLELCPIKIDDDYAKKWNERMKDFLVLVKDGELLRETLYRKGGLNDPKVGVDKYFMLLKYKEDFYSKEIVKAAGGGSNKHLKSIWVILDSEGNEKVEFENGLSYPYLVKNSCLYTINGNYYNIETGFSYGYTTKSFYSKDFVFLDNTYEKDLSLKGVLKINKQDGSFELFES